MKTLTIGTLTLCLCAATAFAEEERFRPGEFDISPFVTYVDKAGDDWGAGASVTYFVTQNIGVGGVTYWTDWEGTFIDNLSGEAYFRLPIFESLSPYAVGSAGRQFDSEEWISTIGGGLDFRPFEKLAAFADVQWRFADETDNGVMFRFGARFTF